MRKRFFVFAVGFLFCVFAFSDASARRLTHAVEHEKAPVTVSETNQTSGIEAIALSFLVVAISISILQKFISRKRSPVSAHYIVDQVERLQSGVLRRVVGVPAK